MSIVRWSDESDVYVYNSAEGLVCFDCLLRGNNFVTKSYQVMIDHLLEHREYGHKVPQYAIDELARLLKETNNG